jgi:NAD+ kinase
MIEYKRMDVMKMRICMIASGKEISQEIKQSFEKELIENGHIIDEITPDLVIAVGGDGTVLKAVHQYVHRSEEVKFLGIHTGNLGFYADYLTSELHLLLEHINDDDFEYVEFPLLEVKLCRDDDCIFFYALNEVTVVNALRTLKTDIYINDDFFEKFYGTGICISTPSGSTGYNKSLGGAVIHPKLRAYQLTEMASINNNAYRTLGSPIILHEDHITKLYSDDFGEVTITVDHLHKKINGVNTIECLLSERTVKFARAKSIHFFTRVKKAFLQE